MEACFWLEFSGNSSHFLCLLKSLSSKSAPISSLRLNFRSHRVHLVLFSLFWARRAYRACDSARLAGSACAKVTLLEEHFKYKSIQKELAGTPPNVLYSTFFDICYPTHRIFDSVQVFGRLPFTGSMTY